MILYFRRSKAKMGMAPTLVSNNLYYTNYLNIVEWNRYQIEEHVIYGIIEQLHDWVIYGRLRR